MNFDGSAYMTIDQDIFSLRALGSLLKKYVDGDIVVAFSGGMDSTVLLRSVVILRDEGVLPASIRALHINHQISESSNDWENHCAKICLEYGVNFKSVEVSCGENRFGVVTESAARDARYEVFFAELQSNETLLLGHHEDDNLETMFLHLMRGSGPLGLSGIPFHRKLGAGFLLRPLLGCPQSSLREFASRVELDWILDDSNADTTYQRNFLRWNVLPILEKRWPALRKSIKKSMQACFEAQTLNEKLAENDLSFCEGVEPGTLSVSKLLALELVRRKNLIRVWVCKLGLSVPSWSKINLMATELLLSRANITILLDDHRICRFNGLIYGLTPRVLLSQGKHLVPVVESSFALLKNGEVRTRIVKNEGIALSLFLPSTVLEVAYRQGGERIKMFGRPVKSLKKILNEGRVPPWLRETLPLIYLDGQLAFIPGFGADEKFMPAIDEFGCVYDWDSPARVLEI
ncbi:tRNA lysidine(34) synthetase TilS [Gammaproteobacteria bacterium]|nr:tRNA lysidine(34) synthetase TilS [Gammaproteobacteria bacterium]